jgi:hypothetical protein
MFYPIFHGGLAVIITVLLGGCATVVSSVTGDLADGLSEAIVNNDDLEGVRDGAPAFLLLLDGLLVQDPDNSSLLAAAASLNGSYAGAFVVDPARQQLLAGKALELALRGACLEDDDACTARTVPFDEFDAWVNTLDVKDVPMAYSLASAWAGWIQANSDDWEAIAELARVQALMGQVAELDETYENGNVRLYMGVFYTLLPPAQGGKPEAGRQQFEKAIEISDGRNLMAKVMFAESYGRLVFDRELHDRLLEEVVGADPHADGLTLANIVAQEQARALLASADDYF